MSAKDQCCALDSDSRPRNNGEGGALEMMPSEFPTVGELRRAATDISESILEDYWPEGTLPIDPVQIARRLGAEVFTAQLGNDVFGMLVGTPEGDAQIFLDLDQPENRLRFTCAHEIGHYVDRTSRLFEDSSYVDRRSSDSSMSPDEIWANEVAGNLLMPAKAIAQAISEGMTDVQLASRFGVSLAALRYRKAVLAR